MTDNNSDKILIAKAKDVIRLSEKHFCTKSSDFLTPAEAAVLKKENLFSPDSKQKFFGGYDDAERVMLVSFPDYYEDFDPEEVVSILKITGRNISALGHRDFLGSLMGLGIKREKLGDIVISKDGVYVFAAADIACYIKDNLTKVANCGIKINITKKSDEFVCERETEEIRGTVQSLRLDAVLALGLRISRAKALQFIESERVSLNWQTAQSGAMNLKEGDLFSVRGFGRFKLFEIGGTTKKGRTAITVLKYI